MKTRQASDRWRGYLAQGQEWAERERSATQESIAFLEESVKN
jgi:hypothetical protein